MKVGLCTSTTSLVVTRSRRDLVLGKGRSRRWLLPMRPHLLSLEHRSRALRLPLNGSSATVTSSWSHDYL